MTTEINKNISKFFDINGNLNELGLHVSKCIFCINNQFIDDEIIAIAKKTNSTISEVYDLYFAIHNKKKIKKSKKTSYKEFEIINLSQDEKDRLQKIASCTSGDTGKAKIILSCDGKPIVYGAISILGRNLGYSAGYVSCVLKNFKKLRMGFFQTKFKYSEEDLTALWDAGYSKKEISEKLGITYFGVENALKRRGLKIKKTNNKKIDKEKLIELCDKGLCRDDIARELSVHEDTVSALLKKLGKKAKSKKVINVGIQNERIFELYQLGLGVKQIAKEISCCRNTITRRLKNLKYSRNKRLNLEIHDEKIVELCESGFSLSQIAKEIGSSITPIHARLKKHGLKAKKAKRTPKYKDEKMIELFNAGLYARHIAREVGCCLRTVHTCLKKHGLKSRGNCGRPKRNTIIYLTEKEVESLKKMVESGKSLKAMILLLARNNNDFNGIADKLGTSNHYVKKIIKDFIKNRNEKMANQQNLTGKKDSKILYHVTHPDNMLSIFAEGLKANENGEIFLFDNKEDALRIALNQVFLFDGYALFKIKLKDEEIEIDNVAEIIRGKQYFAKTPNIPKERVNLVSCYKILPAKNTMPRVASN